MQEPVLRTLHPSPAREDLVSPSQQLAWVIRRLRQLETVNTALTGQMEQLSAAQSALTGQVKQLSAAQSVLTRQVEQLSAAQASLTAQVRQLRADNEVLRAARGAAPAPSRSPSSPPARVSVRNPAPAVPPAQPVKRPMLAEFPSNDLAFGNKWLRRDQVMSITFLDTLSNAPSDAWDVSLQQDRSVLAWYQSTGSAWLRKPLFRLFIGGKGGVSAHPNSSYLFSNYRSLEVIYFNRCFDTAKTTNMTGMFAHCRRLETLDLSDFDLSSVTDREDMFSDCPALSPKTRETLRAQGFPA